MRAALDLCGSRCQVIGEFAGRNHTMRIEAHVTVLSLLASTSVFAGQPRLDMDLATDEVSRSYGKAHPEVQEFVLHTAHSFGSSGLWLNENAYAALKPEEREARVVYLVKLFDEAEYGRHLCAGLADLLAIASHGFPTGNFCAPVTAGH